MVLDSLRSPVASLNILCLLVFVLCAPTATRADNELALVEHLKNAYPGWKPRGIIDVGANVGGWSTGVRKFYPSARVIMVEAFPQHHEQLSKVEREIGNAIHRIEVLSERDGEVVKFYQSDAHFTTGNSMFIERSVHYKNATFAERTTSTLDKVVATADAPFSSTDYDYLKLDVQGAELMVLKGARNILKMVTFVQLEVALVQYNQGGACFWQIDELMRSAGFYLYELGEISRNPDAFFTKGIGQMDLLYVRQDAEALPAWLKEVKVNMCGSSTQSSSATPMQTQVSLDSFDDIFTDLMLSPWVFAAISFTMGFFFGRAQVLFGPTGRTSRHGFSNLKFRS